MRSVPLPTFFVSLTRSRLLPPAQVKAGGVGGEVAGPDLGGGQVAILRLRRADAYRAWFSHLTPMKRRLRDRTGSRAWLPASPSGRMNFRERLAREVRVVHIA